MRGWYDGDDVIEAGSVEEVEGYPKALALYGPESLVGIEEFTNLERLVLYTCDTPEGLECLARLPKLTSLMWRDDAQAAAWFSGEREIDVGPLGALGGLKVLQLYHHRVANSEALGELKQLERLEFKGPLLGQPIVGLERLTELESLRGNLGDLGGMAVIAGLRKLKRLDLFGVSAGEDFLRLAPLRHLEDLKVRAASDTNIQLPFLPALRVLEIEGGDFPVDPSSLACVPAVEKLHLNRWGSGNYQALAGMLKLRDLRIAQSSAQELAGIGRCGSLERLRMEVPARTTELSELATLSGLKELGIFGATEVDDLDFFQGMPVLESLTLGEVGKVESLGTLPGHDHLKSLTLSEASSLSSLVGVERLTGLVELEVMGFLRAPDVAALKGLKSLKRVTLHGGVDDGDIYAFMDSEMTYPATASFDGLVECPALQAVKLDSDHRTAEIEAALALRRKDRRFVWRNVAEWGDLMLSAPVPGQTIPRLLGPMVEMLGKEDTVRRLEGVFSQVRRWEEVIGLLRGLDGGGV
jgi:hypothetical protein